MSPPPPSPGPPDRDPSLDAAWKLHSTELPPARLDAAILAAAHREARTRPHAVGDDDRVAHARGPSRAWWGLAAAATIGAIAFGLLQLAPPVVTDQSATVATDLPRTMPERGSSADPSRDALPPLAEVPRSPAVGALPPAGAPAVRREDDRRTLTLAPGPVPSAVPRTNAAKPAEQEKRRADTREGQRRMAGESSVAASSADAVTEPPVAAAPPPASPEAPATPSRPFPDATPPPPISSPPSQLPAPTTTSHDALAKSEAAGNALDARRRESGERVAAGVLTQPQAQAARRAQADSAVQGAAAEPVAKLQAARTPAAWIERIRRLHAEQRLDEAARELNAFRGAYPDADKELPPELSAWAAGIKRN